MSGVTRATPRQGVLRCQEVQAIIGLSRAVHGPRIERRVDAQNKMWPCNPVHETLSHPSNSGPRIFKRGSERQRGAGGLYLPAAMDEDLAVAVEQQSALLSLIRPGRLSRLSVQVAQE